MRLLILLVLAGVLTPACGRREGGAGLSFHPPTVELGEVERGHQSVELELFNGLTEPVRLGRPKTSCDCLVASSPPSRLEPGERARFEINLDLGQLSGTFERSLVVPWAADSEGKRGEARVDLVGQVRDPVVLCDPSLLFLRRSGLAGERRVRIFRRDSGPIEVENWKAPPTIKARLIENGSAGVVLGVSVSRTEKASERHEVTIHCSVDGSAASAVLRVELVPVPLTACGRRVFLGPVHPGERRFVRLGRSSTESGPEAGGSPGASPSGPERQEPAVLSSAPAVAVLRSDEPARLEVLRTADDGDEGRNGAVSLTIRVLDTDPGLHEVRIFEGDDVLVKAVYLIPSS